MASPKNQVGAEVGEMAISPWWWLVAALTILIQLAAVYWPGAPGGEQLVTVVGADKVIHALIFGVPTFLLVRLTGRRWLVGAIFAIHAPISELVQWRFLPFRDGDVWDCAADLVGIAVALLVERRLRRAGS